MSDRGAAWTVPLWLDRATAWTWRLLVLTAGVLVLLWLVGHLQIVLLPVLVALLFTALLGPVQRWLRRLHVPALAAVWIVLVLGAALLGTTGWLLYTTVGDEFAGGEQWEEVRDEVRLWLETGPADLSVEEIDDLEERTVEALSSGIGNIGIGRARAVIEVVGAAFLTLTLFFFFLKDGPSMWSWSMSRVSSQRRDVVDRMGTAAFSALGSYMRGVAITGVVDGVLIGVGLVIIGVPLVMPLVVITVLAAFFPIVGATLAGALAALVALVTNGPGDALAVVALTFVVQQVEGDVILPIIMRRQVRLHPAVILTSLAAGGALAGVTGAFVAVPMAAMVAAASTVARETARSGSIVVAPRSGGFEAAAHDD